jgi:hypothetical protein
VNICSDVSVRQGFSRSQAIDFMASGVQVIYCVCIPRGGKIHALSIAISHINTCKNLMVVSPNIMLYNYNPVQSCLDEVHLIISLFDYILNMTRNSQNIIWEMSNIKIFQCQLNSQFSFRFTWSCEQLAQQASNENSPAK